MPVMLFPGALGSVGGICPSISRDQDQSALNRRHRCRDDPPHGGSGCRQGRRGAPGTCPPDPSRPHRSSFMSAWIVLRNRSCSMAAPRARVSDNVGQPTRRRIAEVGPRRHSCPLSRQEPLGLSPQWGRFRNLRLLLRRGAQYRGGRVAHHHCDRADRHRQANGRGASLLPKCGSATRSA